MIKFENFYKLLICFLVLIFIIISFMSFIRNDIEAGFSNLFFALVSLCNIIYLKLTNKRK